MNSGRRRATWLLGTPVVLLFVAGVFAWVYATNPAVPRGEAAEGWLAWTDQSRYLASARAMLRGDLSGDKHWYPPLYPAAGAVFTPLSPAHAFLPVNVLALLWFAFVFLRFSDQYVPRWGSVAVLAGTLLFNARIFENFIVPWTTNLSDALLAAGILGMVWTQEAAAGKREGLPWWRVVLVALCLGLIVPTRPADAVVGLVVGLGFVSGLARLAVRGTGGLPRWPVVAGSLSLALVGPLLLAAFNMAVFREAKGDYVTRHALGFFPQTLPLQLYSFWLDAGPVYARHGAALLERQPWLLLSIPGLLWVLIRGDAALRWLACAVVVLFATYLSFAYIMPGSLWRFMMIHYFKWSFPYLGLFAFLLIAAVVAAWRRGSGRCLPTALLAAGIVLPTSLRLETKQRPVAVEVLEGPELALRCELPDAPVDFVDFSDLLLRGKFEHACDLSVTVDDRPLQWLRDFKPLGLRGGARLLFTSPIEGGVLEFGGGRNLLEATGVPGAVAGSFKLGLGRPALVREPTYNRIASSCEAGEEIRFGTAGRGDLFAVDGWFPPEDWGRWSDGNRAVLNLRVLSAGKDPVLLRFGLRAFVRPEHPTQRVNFTINGREAGRFELHHAAAAADGVVLDLPVPAAAMAEDGVLNVTMDLPDATSPWSLGESADARKLGVGLMSLQVVPAR